MYSFATKYDYGKLYGTALTKLAESYSQEPCDPKKELRGRIKSETKKQETKEDATKES
jgi:hypothetical protein